VTVSTRMRVPFFSSEGAWNDTFVNFPFRTAVLVCFVAILSYLAARTGGTLVLHPQNVWPLWPGCALLVSVLLLAPRRTWPALIVAAMAAFVLYDLQAGMPVESVFRLILADTIEVSTAALIVSYCFDRTPRLHSVKALARYSFVAVILVPLVVSFLGALAGSSGYWVSWRISFFSEAIAFLILPPAIWGWIKKKPSWARESSVFSFEGAALLAALAIFGYFAFAAPGKSSLPTLFYALVPFLLWASLRFGSTGVSTSMIVVCFLSIWGAVHGRGPFTGREPLDNVLSLQQFLLFATIPFMVLAVWTEEQEARLRHAAIVESSDDAILSKDLNGIILSWNGGAQRLFGFTEAEAIGQPITLIIPPERDYEEKRNTERLRAGEHIEHFETVRVTKEMKEVSVSLTLSPLRDSWGRVVGICKVARDLSHRKRAELTLHESEQHFRLVVDKVPVLMWMSGVNRLWTFFNQCWLDFTGLSMEHEIGEGWASGVHPEDVAHCLETYLGAFDARLSFEMEYRLKRFDGKYRWIVNYGVPRFETDGTFCGYIGSCIDITDRKLSETSFEELSGRLITAQEQERTRIARELHDDFSQRLALQSIALAQLWKKIPETEVEERARVRELLKRTQEMSSDMHSLSHQLHSSKLEHVGLVSALKGLCKELSSKYEIQIEFTDGVGVLEIPKDLALCLFRVAQEALGNLIKHSRARQAQVELYCASNAICLRVVDAGMGFDPSDLCGTTGLGLISMRERLRLAGGRLTIHSAANCGTEIVAEVLRAGCMNDAEAGAETVAVGGEKS
jgi:PAS domain S-box-containing protein